jgi:ribokinase
VLLGQPISAQTWLVLQMETPASEVEAAIACAKARHAKVILNLAPALPLAAATLRHVDVLVLNEHEASVLSATLQLTQDRPTDQAAALAREIGTSVIVTLGAEGAIAAEGSKLWRVSALPVQAIDTTGAGDCFVGVLAAALLRGATMPEAMRRAAVAASLACTIVGAMPSFPMRQSIDEAVLRCEAR